MSQHDMVISDASGATVLTDMNNAFQALASMSKGPSAPSTPYSGQFWLDDNTPSSTVWTLSLYDGTDWITLGYFDSTNNVFSPAVGAGSAASPSYTFSSDTNSGFYSIGADQVGVTTGGVGRASFGVSGQGVAGQGTSAGAGVVGTGGPTNGHGVVGTAQGSGAGVVGGSVTGPGVYGTGGTNNSGGTFYGTGTGNGVNSTGGTAGHGVYGISLTTAYAGVIGYNHAGTAYGMLGVTSGSNLYSVFGSTKAFMYNGYACQPGQAGGDSGYVFNFNWTGAALQAWIDSSNLGNVNLSSDRRLKKNIQQLADFEETALDRVMDWQIVRYKWRDLGIFKDDNQFRIGFIADQIQSSSPECVTGDPDAVNGDGTPLAQTLEIIPMFAHLALALQGAIKRGVALKQRVDDLEARIAALEAA